MKNQPNRLFRKASFNEVVHRGNHQWEKNKIPMKNRESHMFYYFNVLNINLLFMVSGLSYMAICIDKVGFSSSLEHFRWDKPFIIDSSWCNITLHSGIISQAPEFWSLQKWQTIFEMAQPEITFRRVLEAMFTVDSVIQIGLIGINNSDHIQLLDLFRDK